MFDFIRKHTRWGLAVVVLLIIPSFVFFGMEGYTGFRQERQVVATVGGQEIMQREWDAIHRQETDRLRAQLPGLDPRLLDSPAARMASLESLVQQRVLLLASQDLRLLPTDQRLQRQLLEDPTISSFVDEQGRIDVSRYRDFLAARGLSAEQFEMGLRRDLALSQVMAGVSGTTFSPDAIGDKALAAFLEQREVQVARFDPADYAATVEPTDEQLQTYYQENLAVFQSPERVDIEYLVLSLDDMAARISVPASEVRNYYDQNTALYRAPEQRRASHILIEADESASASQREAARAKAEELLTQLRADPTRFAELAREHSQDPGSAPDGGDLDFISRGAMVAPFEEAVFALAANEISDVVQTEFGYHIITVTEIRGGERQPFEAVREEIEQGLRMQLAQREFAEAAETFTNTVYEQPDGLEPAAQALGLSIQQASDVQRQPVPGAQGPLADARFVQALFSRDAVQEQRNIDAVDLGNNRLASGRVVTHHPARTLPLDEVRQRVREAVVAREAARLARQAGEAALAAWKADADEAELADAVQVSRLDGAGLPGRVARAVIQEDARALPAWLGVDLGDEGYIVARINSVTPPAELPEGAHAQYASAWSAVESSAYIESLKARYKARITASPPREEELN